MKDPVDREIRLSFWKLHILHHAAKGPVWGLWMMRELAEHGHEVSAGTLYPIFARMQANGWLRSRPVAASKARKSYRITASGRRVLTRLRHEVDELHREIVRGEEPHHGAKRPARRSRS